MHRRGRNPGGLGSDAGAAGGHGQGGHAGEPEREGKASGSHHGIIGPAGLPPWPLVPRSQTVLARLAYVTLFAGVAATAPFLPIYFRSLGIGLGTIALLGALLAGAGLLGSPLWGAIADRLRSTNLVLPAAALMAALAGTLLAFAGWPALIAVVLLLGIGSSGVGPILDTRALETVGDDRHRYGRLRVWGSASFVATAIAVGWLIERTGPRGLFVIYVPMLVLTALVGLGLRPRGHAPALPRLEAVRAVVRSPVLRRFLPALLLCWASSSAVNAFFSIYLGEVGAPDTVTASPGLWARSWRCRS